MTPRFSFLTTAYRTEAYIGTTIESVLAQTLPDWELVVVDNGNSDEMAQIVGRYAASDDRIRLIRQENRGYRGGVMAAAAVAQGEYVCVLDSDDHLLPEFCARIAELLDAQPGVDAVGVDAVRFGDPEHVDLPVPYMRSIGVTVDADPDQPLTVPDIVSGRVPYYTAAIRRSAWEAVGGYEPGIDDVDESVIVWCRLTDKFDVRMLPDRLARYRIRADSLSREPERVEAFERQLIRSFVEGAKVAPSADTTAALEANLRQLRYHQAIRRSRHALLAGDTATARRTAREAFAQRRTVRAGVILAGLSIAPGVLVRVHPAKQALTTFTERTAGRVKNLTAGAG